jgi:hypothetical protein
MEAPILRVANRLDSAGSRRFAAQSTFRIAGRNWLPRRGIEEEHHPLFMKPPSSASSTPGSSKPRGTLPVPSTQDTDERLSAETRRTQSNQATGRRSQGNSPQGKTAATTAWQANQVRGDGRSQGPGVTQPPAAARPDETTPRAVGPDKTRRAGAQPTDQTKGENMRSREYGDNNAPKSSERGRRNRDT